MSYLGLSLGGNPCHLSFWEPGVAKRLDGWKRNCLSKGGMLTLVSSVLDSIPIYFLSNFNLQKRVASINLIEYLMRYFLWEGCREDKRDHLVNWDRLLVDEKQNSP